MGKPTAQLTARARSMMRALAGCALLVVALGCKQDADVVATVEALVDGGTIDLGEPDGGSGDVMVDPTADNCSGGWLYAQLVRVAYTYNCEIPREDFSTQLIATISTLLVGTVEPEPGESRAPDLCDFTLFPPIYYPNGPTPETTTHYILCPAYCAGLQQYVDENAPPEECLMQ